ncbi:MAG TPA: response regulator transcription factor [Verrucomicrobiae bacterium]|nr:response regulator transcription factor [Verrucomicrobiae bacterium]
MNLKLHAPIRVMLVEDHILIRMGLQTAAQIEPDIQVVAEVEDGESAVEAYRNHRPDVVLMDLRLPGIDGIQTTVALKKEFAEAVVLVLSTYGTDEEIQRAVQGGAAGYLLKDMPLNILVEAVRSVHQGKPYFPPEISSRLAQSFRNHALTEREIHVLQMIANGRSNKEIGQALGIVEGTVKAHVTNIFNKLHAADRTQAVTTALKRGLIQLR